MQILLTNDDGIYAPGLRALHDELLSLGDVELVAPAAEQSGVGLSITYLHPLMVHEEFREGVHFGWAVAGSPADCVKLGMLEYCKERPSLVVSGINAGANTGINVLYSGTVAAAIEGAFFGVTSIAVSLSTNAQPDYNGTAKLAVDLIRQILASEPKQGSLWNINFPERSPQGARGVKLATLGVKRHVDVMEKRLDPRGRPYFWSGFDPLKNHQIDPGSDIRELAEGFVTITPLEFDLTSTEEFHRLTGHCWSLPELE